MNIQDIQNNLFKNCVKILSILWKNQDPIIRELFLKDDDSLNELNSGEINYLYFSPNSILFDLDLGFL